MKKIIIRSKNIALRSLKINDVNENYLNWFNDPLTKKFINYSPKNNLYKLKSDVKKLIDNKKNIILGIFTDKNKHIGNVRLHNINLKKSKAFLGILIGDKNWRGKGIGFQTIEMCANFLYNKFKITKIYLGTKINNKLAINSYKNSGFIEYKKNKNDIFFYRDYFKSKIAIGTAQLGSDYGIGNKTGKMDKFNIKKIINTAQKNGMNFIETAQSYGTSEKILGSLNKKNLKIITKLPLKNPTKNIKNWVFFSIKKSLKNLKIKKLHGLLIHNPKQLSGKTGKIIYRSLIEMREKKLINKIGVAVYSVEEIENLLKKFHFDIVSIPFNIFDRRLVSSGLLKKLKNMNIQIFARSIFLQGLLLMKKKQRPIYFNKWTKIFRGWDEFSKKSRNTRLENCLGYVLNYPEIDKIILGFDNYRHFQNLVKSIKPIKIPKFTKKFDNNLSNPTMWSNKIYV